MAGVVLAAAALTLWLPGVALLRLVSRRGSDPLVLLAGAPVLSVAVLWAWAEVLTRLGVSVSWQSALLPVLVLSVVCLLVPRWRGRSYDEVVRLGRAPWVVLLSLSGVVLAAWWAATDALALVPPGTDGQHHGLMAQRIVELGTVDPGRLLVLDVVTGASGGGYYPVGLHTVAALVAMLTGAAVGTALNAVVVQACAVALPAGMALLTRTLFPAYPWAPPLAAVASVAFPAYPYFLGHWGMYPLLVALALAAPTLVLVLAAFDDDRVVAGGVLLGLAGLGLFALHGSELVLVALLAAVLVVGDVVRRGTTHLRVVAIRVAVALPFALFALLPRLGAVSSTPAALADADVLPSLGLVRALVYGRTYLLGPLLWMSSDADEFVGTRPDLHVLLSLAGALVLACLAVVAVVATVRSRQRPEWVLAWVLVAVLGLWAALRLPGVKALTWPWFSQWYRVGAGELLFVAPYLGVGACVLAARLAASRTRLTGALAVGLLVVPLAPQVVDSRAMLAYDFREMSLADPQARAAWAFLQENAGPGDRVLNEHVDGSGWMYPVAGLAPLFTIKREYYAPDDERNYLADHAAELLTDVRAARAADDWQVRWAYVGPRTFPDREVRLDAAAIAASPAWRLVFEQDGARVYERVTR